MDHSTPTGSVLSPAEAGKHPAPADRAVQSPSRLTWPWRAEAPAATVPEPDWASLPHDCWTSVLARPERVEREEFVRWARMLATCTSVCRSLRDAILGPSAGELWGAAVLQVTYPGLSPQQSRGLRAMLAAQGHFAHTLALHGGGWAPKELERLLICFTDLTNGLTLVELTTGEAAVVSRTLSSRPAEFVYLRGSAACLLPKAAVEVELDGFASETSIAADGRVDQAPFQRFLGCLRPLCSLRELNLHLRLWRLTPSFVDQLLVRHPQLCSLQLTLEVDPIVGPHAVECLQRLSSVELRLTVYITRRTGALAQFLQQLSCVQQLACFTLDTKHDMSGAEEALMAACQMQCLILRRNRALALRLRLVLPGITVVFDPA